MAGSGYNARKARTKYAVPIWADALLRDTLDLEADEIGAYHLILYAMWARESCDLPDDDRKLARICRVSKRLWSSRIRSSLEPFFSVGDGVWISRRLRREAQKTEAFLQGQSDRKRSPDSKSDPYGLPEGTQLDPEQNAESSDKHLKSNNAPPTADKSAVQSGEHPTQETKRPSISGGGGGYARAPAREADPPSASVVPHPSAAARPTYRERLLRACGADPVSGLTGPNGRQMGGAADMIEAERWLSDLGFTEDQAVEAVEALVSAKRDGPPSSLKYFTRPLSRLAGELEHARNKPMEAQHVERPDREGSQRHPVPSRPSAGANSESERIARFAQSYAARRANERGD